MPILSIENREPTELEVLRHVFGVWVDEQVVNNDHTRKWRISHDRTRGEWILFKDRRANEWRLSVGDMVTETQFTIGDRTMDLRGWADLLERALIKNRLMPLGWTLVVIGIRSTGVKV